MENIQGGNQFIERQQKAKEERERNILEIINGTDLKENYKFDKKINQDGKLDNNIKVDFKDLDIDEQEKVLRDEKTLVICKNYYTDDYLDDAQNNFRNGEIKNNNEMIEDLHYFRCYTTDMKTITLTNSYSSYIVTNENLEMELVIKN